MSEREDAVARLIQHHGEPDVRKLPLLEFLEACQPGFRRKLDQALDDRGLTMDGTGAVTEKRD